MSENNATTDQFWVTLANGSKVPFFNSAPEMYKHMQECTKDGQMLHYISQLALAGKDAHLCPTALFPEQALAAYSAKNLGQGVNEAQAQWFNDHRGGAQGDYSESMPEKMDAVIRCLRSRPGSKRAYIIVPNNTVPDATVDEDAKCMQLINFMLESSPKGGSQLNASVVFRAQAVEIFPKNIHFIGELMQRICDDLGFEVARGHLLYHACFLVSTRHE